MGVMGEQSKKSFVMLSGHRRGGGRQVMQRLFSPRLHTSGTDHQKKKPTAEQRSAPGELQPAVSQDRVIYDLARTFTAV